jgi:quercetin dioxygenase-like cupin family protein
MNYHGLVLAATLIATQAAAPEVGITSEPHHHLALENKSVRVFNVEIDPQTETLMHWHRHDYFTINLGQAEISNTVKDKSPVSVKFQDGDTRFAAATFAHAVRCTGEQPFRNVTIEILEDESLRHATSAWDPGKNEDRALNIFQGGSQQILFVKDGIRVSEFELRPGAIVPTQHHSGPHLLVAVSDIDIRSDVEGQGPMPGHFKAGDCKWLPGNYSHTLTNTGTKLARFVTLEFP